MNISDEKKVVWLRTATVIALLAGVMSVIGGGAVLSGGDELQLSAGPYPTFVEWFNFIGGFIYLIAGAGVWTRQRWAALLSCLIAATTLLVSLAVGLHVAAGASQDMHLLVNVGLRSAWWLLIAGMAWQWIWRSPAADSPC